jgi:protocatechuate 3,4-dioxygenase beta subunit
MKTKITVLLFCGLLTSSLAPAAESVAQAREAQSLAGTVLDANGQPLPQAQVTLTRIGRSALTDAAGRFVFRNVPTGTHRVQATLNNLPGKLIRKVSLIEQIAHAPRGRG